MFGTFGLRRWLRNQSMGESKATREIIDAYRLELESETSHSSKRGFLRGIARLAKPYYLSQKDMKEKVVAWSCLAVCIGLTFYQVNEVAVGFNEWNKGMGDVMQQSFNAVANGPEALKTAWDNFHDKMEWLAILTGKVLVAGYANYKVGQYAILRWRRWMTKDYEDKWMKSKAYYHMQNKSNPLDNPDQRIQEDPAKASEFAFELFNDALDAGLSLITFSGILWGLSDSQVIMGLEIPKFMFTAVIGYSALGTALTYYASKPLEKRTQMQQRFEANYRSDLKEMHEKREPIALNNAEDVQQSVLKESFDDVYGNSKKIININSYMLALRLVYNRVASAVPLAVTFPQIVGGAMQMGGYFQVAGAFSEVRNSLSFFVNNATRIRAGTAYINRLIDIDDELNAIVHEMDEYQKGAEKCYGNDGERPLAKKGGDDDIGPPAPEVG